MKQERVSTSVPKPVKEGIKTLMTPLGLSESAVAAKLLDEGVKRWLPRVKAEATK